MLPFKYNFGVKNIFVPKKLYKYFPQMYICSFLTKNQYITGIGTLKLVQHRIIKGKH